ncbi:MAG: hypothetical protein CVU48_04915 [Candidatus Cloacimonetes bacterium HGW-Cloacimonetes-1]|jgi:diguanylate cyclase (GGDEF)-like protein|nr:MAG: hypothetical protein CVU48_04915 [Candidatus Cloacimonetes bacterium HGW-Cloacimonetes-1]
MRRWISETNYNLDVSDEVKRVVSQTVTELMSGVSDLSYLVTLLEDQYQKAGNDPRVFGMYSLYLINSIVEALDIGSDVQESDSFQLLTLLNCLPMKPGSLCLSQLLKHVEKYDPDTPFDMKTFDELQLMIIALDIGDYEFAEEMADSIKEKLDSSQSELLYVFQMHYAILLNHKQEFFQQLIAWLSLIGSNLDSSDVNRTVYLLLRWLDTLDWHHDVDFKKVLLLKIYKLYPYKKNLNTAMLLWELFRLDAKHVTPSEKMQFVKKLIQHAKPLMHVQQLQSIYYFAGNYSSGIQSRIKESLTYYQSSNYYLKKSWDLLRDTSSFLRKYASPEQYVGLMDFIEEKIVEFSNQVSLQNICYMETLEAEYTKIEDLYREVEHLSLTDSLTGLRNRRYLDNNIYHLVLLAIRQSVPISYAMIDIDHFKPVNDNHGHQVGDFILQEIASILENGFRKSDVVIRYGGEEFLVVMFDADQEWAISRAEKLRNEIEEHDFRFEDRSFHVTISIGLSFSNYTAGSEPNLTLSISEADKALYEAKSNGRNQVRIYSLEIQS